MKKTLKRVKNGCSYERTFSSNFWVLWQPPIEIVTPYFRGLVPYAAKQRQSPLSSWIGKQLLGQKIPKRYLDGEGKLQMMQVSEPYYLSS